MQMKDRVALVTGGAQGLGEGIAKRYVAEGAAVVLADRNLDKAKAVAAEIKAGGGRALAVGVDVSKVDQIEAAVRDAMAAFGRIDVLVNSAGIFVTGSIAETTEKVWDDHMAINVKGSFFMTRAVAPIMQKQHYGRVILLSSIAGLGGFLNCPAYCASKGALVNLTKALACELGPSGITVNAIAPGPVETPINDQFNWNNPKGDAHRKFLAERTPTGVSFYKVEDITGTALYFALEESRAITGVIIPVDGGWTAW